MDRKCHQPTTWPQRNSFHPVHSLIHRGSVAAIHENSVTLSSPPPPTHKHTPFRMHSKSPKNPKTLLKSQILKNRATTFPPSKHGHIIIKTKCRNLLLLPKMNERRECWFQRAIKKKKKKRRLPWWKQLRLLLCLS